MEYKPPKDKNALQLDADELLGLNFELITIAGRSFAIYPPSIETLSRMARVVESFSIDGMTNREIAGAVVENNERACLFLAHAIVGNSYRTPWGRLRFWFIRRRLRLATGRELAVAMRRVQEINSLNDFFLSAHLMWAVTTSLVPSEDEQ